MAVRAPTDFTRWLDQRALLPKSPVVTTVPSLVADDQSYIIDARELVILDLFPPRKVTGGSTEIMRYYVDTKDECGTGTGAYTHEYAVLLGNDDGASTGAVTVKTNADAGGTTLTVDAGDNPMVWDYNSIDLNGNGNEECVIVELARTAGAGGVYVAGFALWTYD